MRQHFVYLITHVATGRHYVGKTSVRPERRWAQHRRAVKRRRAPCVRLHRAMRKYGLSEFRFRVIETCETEADALRLEACWIAELRTQDVERGFNIHADGHGGTGHPVSEATRTKLRAANLGKKYSAETRAKLSAMRIGRKRPPRSDEWCRKLSEAKKRETANGTRDWSALHRPETKAKLKGIPKTLTPEARAAMKQRVSEQMKARWADPEYRKLYSAKAAAKKASGIKSVAKSLQKSAWNRLRWQDPEYRAKMSTSISRRARERAARKRAARGD